MPAAELLVILIGYFELWNVPQSVVPVALPCRRDDLEALPPELLGFFNHRVHILLEVGVAYNSIYLELYAKFLGPGCNLDQFLGLFTLPIAMLVASQDTARMSI